VSSPITFSGFNNIDFNTVLTALMAQATQPLTNLQNQQSNLKAQSSTYDALASQLTSLNNVATALGPTGSVSTLSASSSDSSSVGAQITTGATAGRYEVVVNQLARAQVTASASTSPDANTTTVATGGTITIGGKVVTVSGSVTLQGLATAINGTTGIGVTASVVQSGTNAFRLVLTGQRTGAANAFTVANALTGGAGVSFTDTDGDGLSGNSTADNAQQATDANLLVNNVAIVSSSNTLTSAIPGVTLQLSRQDPTETIGITVATDGSALESNLQSFISAYNSFASFANTQSTAAANGDPTSIGHDALLRGLRNQLRASLQGTYGTGTYTNLAQIGVEFTQTGTLQLNESVFQQAVTSQPSAVQALVSGSAAAFDSISAGITQYTQSSGLISLTKQTLATQASQLTNQITAMQSRLDLERATLQAQFTAADSAISALQSQTSSLSGLSGSLAQNPV
jgi:flagellar hook-associated protein 2